MASLISDVIKDVFQEASQKKITLTPDNYHTLFCAAAARRGLSAMECKKLENYISKLDQSYQNELKKMNVRNIDELFAFISSRLNRANPTDITKISLAQTMLLKRILHAINLLHNTKAKDLANSSISMLDGVISVDSLNLIRDRWFDFVSHFDDNYIKRLEKYGIKQSDDIESIISKIEKFKDNSKEQDLKYLKICDLLIAALVPSIAPSADDDIAAVSEHLRQDPALLSSPAMEDDIKRCILKRVRLDQNEIKHKIAILDGILNSLNTQIQDFATTLLDNGSMVDSAIFDMDSITSIDDYNTIKLKLQNTSNSLRSEIKAMGSKLSDDSKVINNLKERVKELEEMIARANIQKDEITGLNNKSSFEMELASIEEANLKYGVDYAIMIIGINGLDDTSAKYGANAKDAILSTMAKIIQNRCLNGEFIARTNTDEFVILVANLDTNGCVNLAQMMLNDISGYKFRYKNEHIIVGASCGIAIRSSANNQTDMIQRANLRLKSARSEGLNCIKAI
ncbi:MULTISPECIES: GGDEF domain-containing protein [Campylobacter]|uniref:GGDEF domain-containing protein n=1 Tax=Campylobacter porcelli TaxID=1660073 RepID=A0ABU7M536_9BACT|nr:MULTISPECIES: GGDEF domain-containing protein [unclassified Campylobacter]MCR8679423.1 GGDEF domain-containing protein [Campylobacter sp. RM19072]MCR8696469.1 GGDEF domain-containing protein [Campylobacter sp. RM19073]MEE3703997.1 GGDEF domain-containing protein [Campylobacter sp. CX2-8023-23]MEE3744831.1 GGDEF domain-containing protein [Campylobacter sp. CX2-4855-23]